MGAAENELEDLRKLETLIQSRLRELLSDSGETTVSPVELLQNLVQASTQQPHSRSRVRDAIWRMLDDRKIELAGDWTLRFPAANQQ